MTVESEATPGPRLEYPGMTPYDIYVRTDVLHSIQQRVSDEPGEYAFLAASQIMELYFAMLRFEWQHAQSQLRVDAEAWGAIETLRRSELHFEGLNASWAALRWITPTEFNRFREHLGVASGFQSWAYRHCEFLLGLKNRALIRLYEPNPAVYGPLLATLEGPGLYDDVLAMLARRGFPIPAAVLTRDMSVEYAGDEAVEAVWVSIMKDARPDNDLRALGFALADLSEKFDEWRYLHLMAVRRAMGAKGGTGGSSGLDWLEKSMKRRVFPELWSARTSL